MRRRWVTDRGAQTRRNLSGMVFPRVSECFSQLHTYIHTLTRHEHTTDGSLFGSSCSGALGGNTLFFFQNPAPFPSTCASLARGGDLPLVLPSLVGDRDQQDTSVFVASSNKDGLENGGGGADVSDCGEVEWASDEASVAQDARGLADGADRVPRRMGREQSRGYSPGKRSSGGRSSRLSSLNMKMCTLITPTPVE